MTATGARSPAAGSPPPELVARFEQALERLWPEGGRLGLAVSGGPDSMAMLLLAEAAIPGQFEVATVDHGLRAEAKDECATVERTCTKRKIHCAVLQVEVEAGNLQQQARLARYAALEEWARDRGLDAIATAHHADDQAETLIMRLNRGSGLSGLAGVRSVTTIGATRIVRPLLSFRRAELARVVEAAGIDFARDPSNKDETYDRVRIRKVLAEADWLDPLAVAKSAELLAEAEFYVSDALNRCWNANVDPTDDGYRYFPGASPYENREIVMHILQQMGAHTSRSDVARVVERLWEGENASLGGVLGRPGTEPNGRGADGRVWVFRPEPPRQSG
jgi:tRNA(Ile)-lysidine synthase